MDRAFASKLMWVAVGLATALTGSVLPALWLFSKIIGNHGTNDIALAHDSSSLKCGLPFFIE